MYNDQFVLRCDWNSNQSVPELIIFEMSRVLSLFHFNMHYGLCLDVFFGRASMGSGAHAGEFFLCCIICEIEIQDNTKTKLRNLKSIPRLQECRR